MFGTFIKELRARRRERFAHTGREADEFISFDAGRAPRSQQRPRR